MQDYIVVTLSVDLISCYCVVDKECESREDC